jgi:D-amino peptidase
MRVFLSVDIEGVAGVVDESQWRMGEINYDRARELMVQEANAAIEGALAAGAKDIVVNDSHHRMVNLDPARLHPAARLLMGRVKPMSMCQGLGPGFDAAAFIGYHAGRGALRGCLDHTYTGILHGLVAGHFGCPLVFVSGDQTLAEEMREWNPKIRTCIVKESLARQAVLNLHPEKAREMIRAGIEKALRAQDEIDPLRLDPPLVLEIELHNAQMADICERIVGVERKGGRTVRAEAKDVLTLFRYFLNIMSMSGTVA